MMCLFVTFWREVMAFFTLETGTLPGRKHYDVLERKEEK